MHLVLRLTEAAVEHVDVLAERLEEHLAALAVDARPRLEEGRAVVAVDDDAAADVAWRLSRVPGVAAVLPAVKAEADEAAVAAAVDEVTDADVVALEDGTDLAVAEAVTPRVDEAGETVHLAPFDDAVYVASARVDGVGGAPVGSQSCVVVLMEDRASTVAAAELLVAGHAVYPVAAGAGEEVGPELDILRQFDPGLKLTTVDAGPGEAVARCCELYGCDRYAVGATADDPEPEYAVEAALMRPNAELSDDAVLDRYAELAAAVADVDNI